MRVGVLVHDLHGGGAEPVARSWAASLRQRGHAVVFLLYGPDARDGAADEPARVVFPGRTALARWTGLPRWVRRVAREQELDVVLSVLDLSNLAAVGAALTGGPPAVISEHAVPSLLWRHKGAAGVVKRVVARRLYRRASAAVAVSHAVATDLRTSLHVPPDRLAVLPNPVLTQPAGAGSLPAAAPGGPRRVLVVGRCAPEKGVDRALDVVRELRRRGLDWTGCVLGDGPLRAQLEDRCRREGLPVEFAGWVDDWTTRARPGDVLLLASDLEGFGLVLVEAAAASVPSVAPSPALGVADAVVPGLTGVLSPTDRVDDLADAVLRAAQLPWHAEAVQAWLCRFSPDAAGERLEALLLRATAPERVVTHVGHHPDAQGGIASVLRTYRDAGVPGWQVRFLRSYDAESRLRSAVPAARALAPLLLPGRPAVGVVHAHLSHRGSFVREGGLAVLSAARGRPVVVTVHGSDFPRFLREHRRLVLAVLRRARAVVVLSEHHRALLPADLQARSVLVPNTVRTGAGPVEPPPDAPRAVFAGEVSRRKGVDVLLQAWPDVRAALPLAELVVAGPPGDVVPVELPGVTWTGPLDNDAVRDELRRARAAVLPSRREVMPVFVLEAMAAGRAVVATPVGAVAETVGEAGTLVPVDDAGALAAALVAVLGPGPRAALAGASARSRFDACFAPVHGLGALRDVYEAAVAPGRRP